MPNPHDVHMQLDNFDKQILEILSHEDINLNELSERIHLSVSSVHRRIKNLIDHNIISGLKREINYKKLGFSLHIILQVSLNKHDTDTFNQFLEELKDIPEVINAFLITGQSADFLVEVVAKDMENYSDVLLKRMGKIEHVAALHSSFVIKEYDVLDCSALLSRM
jgi:Lrp/AsnC family leucine-responsive transcriptional regulator